MSRNTGLQMPLLVATRREFTQQTRYIKIFKQPSVLPFSFSIFREFGLPAGLKQSCMMLSIVMGPASLRMRESIESGVPFPRGAIIHRKSSHILQDNAAKLQSNSTST